MVLPEFRIRQRLKRVHVMMQGLGGGNFDFARYSKPDMLHFPHNPHRTFNILKIQLRLGTSMKIRSYQQNSDVCTNVWV